MSTTNQTEAGKATDTYIEATGLTPAQMQEYNSRFKASPGAVVDFQLFRVVPPKGPAQPVPAQIPVGSTNDLKEAIELADRLNENTTILICRREWFVKTDDGWGSASVGQQIPLKENQDEAQATAQEPANGNAVDPSDGSDSNN